MLSYPGLNQHTTHGLQRRVSVVTGVLASPCHVFSWLLVAPPLTAAIHFTQISFRLTEATSSASTKGVTALYVHASRPHAAVCVCKVQGSSAVRFQPRYLKTCWDQHSGPADRQNNMDHETRWEQIRRFMASPQVEHLFRWNVGCVQTENEGVYWCLPCKCSWMFQSNSQLESSLHPQTQMSWA